MLFTPPAGATREEIGSHLAAAGDAHELYCIPIAAPGRVGGSCKWGFASTVAGMRAQLLVEELEEVVGWINQQPRKRRDTATVSGISRVRRPACTPC